MPIVAVIDDRVTNRNILARLAASVEEGLQVRELVAGTQLVEVRVRQFDAIPFSQGENQLRFQGSLDVEVQFRHRQQLDGLFRRSSFGHSLFRRRSFGRGLFDVGYRSIAEC